ncbi:MAG: FixH family protein [Paenibacillaceae bacterium]|uniref:FixH family protein n=1 Tax=Paenibacillus mellifer TaxID=2937794 RepID=A0A9X1XZK9_9BACL|nr:FixH family protein [Paenibacillus mellifer]MBW4841017.1 FixH family protein [Paenibacillaceae bacterium]MCK8486836.1 FixH family protein [Paenibacillus mellifer]
MRNQRITGLFATLMFILVVIAGCGSNKSTSAQTDTMLVPIQVELEVAPSPIKTGDSVKFTAKVTHQGENVDDAKEVMFEFWNTADDNAKHNQVQVKSAGNGTYVLEHTFEEPGTYEVISHVTARDQHSMPSKQFTVE